MEESLKSLSMDYHNLLINGQIFSDVTFSVDGRLVHAHRCILAARSLFFRNFFCNTGVTQPHQLLPHPVSQGTPIPVDTSVGYDVFMIVLQFLYSGQVVAQKRESHHDCSERGCWHEHCTLAVNLALGTLAAARAFGIEPLILIMEKQLVNMAEKASIEDVTKILIASDKPDTNQLWTTCAHIIAKSNLPFEILTKHIPINTVSKIQQLRHQNSSFPSDLEIHRVHCALASSDIELVKLMVIGEGLNLDRTLALHYAVENCTREVVKALLELDAANVNYQSGHDGRTPLHIAAEMVCPDMVAVLLDHHADPNVRSFNGMTPLDVLRSLTSEFLFKGAVPGLVNVEPNKLQLCLELMQSAASVRNKNHKK